VSIIFIFVITKYSSSIKKYQTWFYNIVTEITYMKRCNLDNVDRKGKEKQLQLKWWNGPTIVWRYKTQSEYLEGYQGDTGQKKLRSSIVSTLCSTCTISSKISFKIWTSRRKWAGRTTHTLVHQYWNKWTNGYVVQSPDTRIVIILGYSQQD